MYLSCIDFDFFTTICDIIMTCGAFYIRYWPKYISADGIK